MPPVTVSNINAMRVFEDRLLAIQSQISRYAPGDVFCIGETGLYYQAFGKNLPNKRCNREGETHEQGQFSNSTCARPNEKMCVATCTNADGSEKLPCWAICRFISPRCFIDVDREHHGISYAYDPQSNMSPNVFRNYLLWFDGLMHGRRVLLIADYSETHVSFNERLLNTEFVVLPPNANSLGLHPGSIGISRMIKTFYRRRFAEIMMARAAINNERKFVSVLEAMNVIVQAWQEDMMPEFIIECFLGCQMLSEKFVKRGTSNHILGFRQLLQQKLTSTISAVGLDLMDREVVTHDDDFNRESNGQNMISSNAERLEDVQPQILDMIDYNTVSIFDNLFDDLQLMMPPIDEIFDEIHEEVEKLGRRRRSPSIADRDRLTDTGDSKATPQPSDVISNQQPLSSDIYMLPQNDALSSPIHEMSGMAANGAEEVVSERRISNTVRPKVSDAEALMAIDTIEKYWLARNPASLRLSVSNQRHEILKRLSKGGAGNKI